MTRSYSSQGRLQGLQGLDGLLWSVIDKMDDAVIKACGVTEMVQLGVKFRQVGRTTIEGHAADQLDRLSKRLSSGSKGVLRQMTAAQDLPETNTRIRCDLDKTHCRFETLLAGFPIALQMKQRFTGKQEAGGTLLGTADMQQVGLG